jgi:hypothetical protein
MSKSVEGSTEFIKPGLLDALKQELALLETVEPGSKSIGEAIADLLPLIRGCRDQGHSWSRISLSVQKFIPGVSAASLRRYVYDLDPSLKGTVKGVSADGVASSVVPALDEDKTASEEDDSWPPSSSVVEDEDED